MTIFPNAKINIGLRIISVRSDGFHNIESLFYPVGATDALEFVPAPGGQEKDSLKITGLKPDCSSSENTVLRALEIARKHYNIPPLRIHLHKTIPSGSGLGGGSSDAAFMLSYLNRYFKLGAGTDMLSEMALQIGSDCAFFIRNEPAIVSGRGEILTDIRLSLKGKYLLLLHPGIFISTAEAYSMVSPSGKGSSISKIIQEPLASWKQNLKNDFQEVITAKYPLIGELIENIYNNGALYSSMSGSGSAVYGIFENKPDIAKYERYWVWSGLL
ncbi:MAG: 4-(cytidine 5'-diphospho)-2-C-methyl-D-erythritol kinase [Bacteroidales bacterium]|nr:4-(cytidine 5'-diphospho)-2-C-methyl-D-erythritol kinase [Bacteroidales bacterium]